MKSTIYRPTGGKRSSANETALPGPNTNASAHRRYAAPATRPFRRSVPAALATNEPSANPCAKKVRPPRRAFKPRASTTDGPPASCATTTGLGSGAVMIETWTRMRVRASLRRNEELRLAGAEHSGPAARSSEHATTDNCALAGSTAAACCVQQREGSAESAGEVPAETDFCPEIAADAGA